MEKEFDNHLDNKKDDEYASSVINELNEVAEEVKQTMQKLNKQNPEDLKRLYKKYLDQPKENPQMVRKG